MTSFIIILIAITIAFLAAVFVGSALYARNKKGLAVVCMSAIILAGVILGVFIADRIVGISPNMAESDRREIFAEEKIHEKQLFSDFFSFTK